MNENGLEKLLAYLRGIVDGTDRSLWNHVSFEVQIDEMALLLAEIERLRERLTITDERVGAAAFARYKRYHGITDRASRQLWDQLEPNIKWDYLTDARAVLLAAGMVEAKP